MKKLIIVGAGGHGRVVLDIAIRMQRYKEVFFIEDDKCKQDIEICGYKVIGGKTSLEKQTLIADKEIEVIVAIGDNKIRGCYQIWLKAQGYKIANIIDPLACVSAYATLGEGIVMMQNVVVQTGSKIGDGTIINTGSIVEHECSIGDYVHLSPRVVMGGCVNVGERTWLGIGATISNNIEIGKACIIGAGAVVINAIGDNVTAIGIPAKEMRKKI